MAAPSLRDRTRERRRAAIARAAVTLFADGGYDATTVADIAEAAEVSPRTVSLYFPAKLELALVYTTDAAHRFADVISSRTDESFADLCALWVQEEFRSHDQELALHRAMLAANPALRGAQTREVTEAKGVVGAALAAELDRPLSDPMVAVVGGAVDGALAALLQLPPQEVQASGATLSTIRLVRLVMESAREGRLDR
jgi:AcrR family transcriptional regulator